MIFSIVWPISSIHPFAILGDRPDKTFASATSARTWTSCPRPGSSTSTRRRSARRSPTRRWWAATRVHVSTSGRPRARVVRRPASTSPRSASRPTATRSLLKGCAKDRAAAPALRAHHAPARGSGRRRPRRRPARDAVPRHAARCSACRRVPGRRSKFDIQSQDLPVIYIPGFLGSEIQCDGADVLDAGRAADHMRPIGPLGRRAHEPDLPERRGRPASLVGTFMLARTSTSTRRVAREAGPRRRLARRFGWDWRKAPQDSLDELDAKIDGAAGRERARRKAGRQARHARRPLLRRRADAAVRRRHDPLAQGRADAHRRRADVGLDQAVLPARLRHRGDRRVARSTCSSSNEDLKDTMRNFAGAYHLLADDNFGQWLTVDGAGARPGGREGFLRVQSAATACCSRTRRKTHRRADRRLARLRRADRRARRGRRRPAHARARST